MIHNDESIIFNLLRAELSKESGVDEESINNDTILEEELGLYDEDIERVLVEVQDCLCLDSDLIGINALVDCTTVGDIIEVILSRVDGTSSESSEE